MSSKFREHTRGKIIHFFVMNKRKLADERLLKEQCKKISTSAMIKATRNHSLHVVIRVGQGFWVFGIQGRFKSGIRYIAA